MALRPPINTNTMPLLKKKKFQNFLYIHTVLVLGLILFPWTVWNLVVTFLATVWIVLAIQTLIYHHYFNHDYIKFKNSVLEILGLWWLTVYHYWRFDDARSYHVCHHRNYGTDQDPTSGEIKQGPWKFYVGLTNPMVIPKIDFDPTPATAWFNHWFWTVKLSTYTVVVLIAGWSSLWWWVLLPQCYMHLLMRLHEYVFHSTTTPKNLPWLFPVFLNDAWHITHHEDDRFQDPWQLRWINPQWYFYKLFFTPTKAG